MCVVDKKIAFLQQNAVFLDFAICKMDGCWLVTKPNKMKIFLLAIHISMKLLTTF